ncbi:hypothetical protein [Leptospira bandrabouensis]|uniref:hypothetical protein n=1 Tax=Leptospira bandrabouensis TaxID=2484903 RepID=UPI001EE8159F|nr:hypothetical protein [Leptospira bandrabouensis]MCG6146564.1 hypothetical protein [Leptospira bandrabouensis]MCG6161985.1 hypothetical protein [Leptospira bandrabouensis]MCG6166169.1 hypothetical protein [Leptospira bandrabouensis]
MKTEKYQTLISFIVPILSVTITTLSIVIFNNNDVIKEFNGASAILTVIGIILSLTLLAFIFLTQGISKNRITSLLTEIEEKQLKNDRLKKDISLLADIKSILERIIKTENSDTKENLRKEALSSAYKLNSDEILISVRSIEKINLNEDTIIRLYQDRITREIERIENIIEDSNSIIEGEKKKSYDEELVLYESYIRERILIHIDKLGNRSLFYLVIGSIIAVIGFIILYSTLEKGLYFVNLKENTDLSTKMTDYIVNFSSRISVIIVIEIFAFYFLRLHRIADEKITYFQNELTTIDTKLIALMSSKFIKNDGIQIDTLKSLTSLERNPIFKKEETTSDLEKLKSEIIISKTIFDKFVSLFELKRPSA